MDITRIFKPMAEAGGKVLILSSELFSRPEDGGDTVLRKRR
jgi:hypothetical protein